MGLYGDILRAADGSIFTFDKIIEFKDLGFQKEETETEEEVNEETEADGENATSTEEEVNEETETEGEKATPTEKEIDAKVSSLAEDDGIFLGRFILLTEKLWVYVKTHNGEKYTYTKIAKLHSLNSLNEENTDKWIEIEDNSGAGPCLYHAEAGPEIVITEDEEQITITNEDEEYYNEGTSFASEKSALNFVYYDLKGHAYKCESIKEKPQKYFNGEEDFTLVLNGGGFLGKDKYLTKDSTTTEEDSSGEGSTSTEEDSTTTGEQ